MFGKVKSLFFKGSSEPLPIEQNLTFTQEGTKLRVQGNDLNYLFRDGSKDHLLSYLRRNFPHVSFCDTPLTVNGRELQLEKEALDQLKLRVLLSWYYYHIVNHLKPRFAKYELAHPHTKDILRSEVEKRYGKNSQESFLLGAHLLSIGMDDYIGWARQRDKFFASF